jgi:hypothetical protein
MMKMKTLLKTVAALSFSLVATQSFAATLVAGASPAFVAPGCKWADHAGGTSYLGYIAPGAPSSVSWFNMKLKCPNTSGVLETVATYSSHSYNGSSPSSSCSVSVSNVSYTVTNTTCSNYAIYRN